jgi:hypothetical protein
MSDLQDRFVIFNETPKNIFQKFCNGILDTITNKKFYSSERIVRSITVKDGALSGVQFFIAKTESFYPTYCLLDNTGTVMMVNSTFTFFTSYNFNFMSEKITAHSTNNGTLLFVLGETTYMIVNKNGCFLIEVEMKISIQKDQLLVTASPKGCYKDRLNNQISSTWLDEVDINYDYKDEHQLSYDFGLIDVSPSDIKKFIADII